MKTMKAMRVKRFGGPESVVVEEIPIPKPGAGEALIKVEAAAINPIDWKLREGMNQDLPLPFTLGVDFCGVIEQLGPGSPYKAGTAAALKPHDEVYGAGGSGADAEYLVAPLSQVARKPSTLSAVEAASVPVVGLTAWQGLFTHGELRAGQTVLILGASGGVGRFAVQLAASAGAKVYGTASGDLESLRKLGCERPIDYKKEHFEDVVMDADLCLDLVGGELQERALAVVKRGGRLVSTVEQPSQSLAARHGVQALFFVMRPDASQLEGLGAMIDAGKLTVEVAKVLPLKKAAEGEELNRRQKIHGKIVLTV
jgi:NADPH:quinone reductase-like Zn-dependent oxidoreductase